MDLVKPESYLKKTTNILRERLQNFFNYFWKKRNEDAMKKIRVLNDRSRAIRRQKFEQYGKLTPNARSSAWGTSNAASFGKSRYGSSLSNQRYAAVLEKPLPVVDPIIFNLEVIVGDIKELKQEAEKYSYEHINQDFRRINASLIQCQLKLDRVDIQGREDARQKRKEGIRLSERGANALMEKIHKQDYRNCEKCLKL